MSENNGATGRICKCCGDFKSWESFDKKNDGLNGRHSQCKICVAHFKKKWWKKKNVKQRIRPTVLEFSSSDVLETSVPFTSGQSTELEKILRSMVFDSLSKGRRL